MKIIYKLIDGCYMCPKGIFGDVNRCSLGANNEQHAVKMYIPDNCPLNDIKKVLNDQKIKEIERKVRGTKKA